MIANPRPAHHRSVRALGACVAAATVLVGGCSAPSATAEADGPTVETAIGPVTAPADVDSVVVLEGRRDLDIVLSLGLPLAGMPYEGPDSGLDLEAPLAAATAAAQQEGAEELFLADEIDVEAIAAAAPALIVGRLEDVEPILEELRAIAPVIPVSAHGDGVSWQEDLQLVAEATGTEDRATELISAYDARVDEVATTWAAQIAATPVVPLGYGSEGTQVQGTRLQSVVLEDVGAVPAAAFAEALAADDAVERSPEQTLQAYADAGAVLALANTEDEWAAAQADPLWTQLPAVATGRVVRTDKMTHEGGPTTAMHVLDLVEQLYRGA